MSKIHHLHGKDDIKQDAKFVNDLLLFCKAGRVFYQQAARKAEQQTLRNLLLGMADVRERILEELAAAAGDVAQPELRQNDEAVPAQQFHQDALMRILRWYAHAMEFLESDQEQIFIERMLQEERAALLELRRGARSLQTRRFSNMLASHIASIQMVFDQLRALSQVRSRQ